MLCVSYVCVRVCVCVSLEKCVMVILSRNQRGVSCVTTSFWWLPVTTSEFQGQYNTTHFGKDRDFLNGCPSIVSCMFAQVLGAFNEV